MIPTRYCPNVFQIISHRFTRLLTKRAHRFVTITSFVSFDEQRLVPILSRRDIRIETIHLSGRVFEPYDFAVE
jgi:hypothetical protein